MRYLLSVLLVCLGVGAARAANDEGYDYSRGELFSIIENLAPGADLFALPPAFELPKDARAGSSYVVDASHHVEDKCDCRVDWRFTAGQKVDGAYYKATQGAGYVDPTVTRNAKALQMAALDFGLYHFLSSKDGAESQVANFQKVLDSVGAYQLPPSLDLEWDPVPYTDDCPDDAVIIIRKRNGDITKKCDHWGFVAADEIIARANTWLDAVRTHTKREPVLYTSAAWLKPRLGSDARISEIHAKIFWFADYSRKSLGTEKPHVPKEATLDLWQFTESGKVKTSDGRIGMDVSIFSGDAAALKERLHASP